MTLTDKEKAILSRLKRKNRRKHIRDLATGEWLFRSRAKVVTHTLYVAIGAMR